MIRSDYQHPVTSHPPPKEDKKVDKSHAIQEKGASVSLLPTSLPAPYLASPCIPVSAVRLGIAYHGWLHVSISVCTLILVCVLVPGLGSLLIPLPYQSSRLPARQIPPSQPPSLPFTATTQGPQALKRTYAQHAHRTYETRAQRKVKKKREKRK